MVTESGFGTDRVLTGGILINLYGLRYTKK